MPKKVIKYKCSFCNKFEVYKKEHVIKHEDYCFRNPKNKACLTCKYCKKRYRNTVDELEKYIGFIWTCTKKDINKVTLSEEDVFTFTFAKQNINNKTNNIIVTSKMFEKNKLVFPTSKCELYKLKTNKK